MRATRRSVRRPAAVQYREPDSADSSPLASSGAPAQSSAGSISWSDAETSFDRLLRGQVFQKVKIRANPFNESSLSCGSDQAPSIRLFESPSAVPPVPPGKTARRRGKENRTSKAYGGGTKRSSVVPSRTVVPEPQLGRTGLSGSQTSLSAEPPGRHASAERGEGGVFRRLSVEQGDDALSPGREGGDVLSGVPARLLDTGTPGPSASTPVPGRLWSAVPLVSPVPPGTGGASPELTAAAGRRLPSGSGSGTPDRPPPSADIGLTASAGDTLPSPRPSLEPAGPPVLEPPSELSGSLNGSLLPPPRLSLAPIDSPPLSMGSPAAGGVPSSSRSCLDISQPAGSGDLSEAAGYPVNMLPRCRSGIFSSDEEAEEWAPAAEGTEVGAVCGETGRTARDVHVSPAAEAPPDMSRFTDSELGAGLRQDVSAGSIGGGGGSPDQTRERPEAVSGVSLFDSSKADIDNVSPLHNCFIRLDRLNTEELGELRGAAESAITAELNEDAAEDPVSEQVGDETGDPRRSQASVVKLARCFVRLCRLEMTETETGGVGSGETKAEMPICAREAEPEDGSGEAETENGSGEAGPEDGSGEAEAKERDDLSEVGAELKSANSTKAEESDSECLELPGTENGPGRAQARAQDNWARAEVPAEALDGGAMEVDSDGGHHSEEARQSTDGEELSLPSLTLPNSPESGETGRPSVPATPSLGGVLLALRSGKGWRRSLCQLEPPAAPGLDRLRPLPEGGAEPADWRGSRSTATAAAAGVPERRGSLQPAEPGTGYASRHRSLRSRRMTMAAFREVAEEAEDQEDDDVGATVDFRQLRSGRRSVMPLREKLEEEDSGAVHTLRSGRRLSMLPPRQAPYEAPRGAAQNTLTSGPRAPRGGRRSMMAQPSGQTSEAAGTVAESRPQAGRRRSMQLHRELSDDEYSRALAALQSLRDALPTLSTPLGKSEPTSGPAVPSGDALFSSPLPAAGPRDRRSVRLSLVPLADCAPTPHRRSVLPVGFSPAPVSRRSSVYVSSDAAEAGAGAAADVSLSYEDPAGRVLELCGLQQPTSFVQYCRRSKVTKKIGEGVYGEVFLCETKTDRSVIKIMPIEGDFEVNDAAQKSYGEVLSELLISKSLSDLHSGPENAAEGFVRLLSSHVVRGAYPARLNKLWDQFDRDKGSENEHPRLFPVSQLFLVLEYSHAGADLESFQFKDVDQAIASFYQVAFSLAVGEAALEFEHRDLHWGNVLLREEPADHLPGILHGRRYRLPTGGLRATLIDFTLSRLRADGAVVYNNLAEDPTLFSAHGDHQFEVYRQMRAATSDLWRQHCPETNVQWLYYLADKLCAGCAYEAAGSRHHRQQLRRLHQLRQQVNEFCSAAQLVEALCEEWLES